MNYKIQLGYYEGSEWNSPGSELPSYGDDFEGAKLQFKLISDNMSINPELYENEDGTVVGARLIDEFDETKPPRIIHYITIKYPNISLPSAK